MVYIETESVDAAFHFSVEEYIVKNYPWDEPVLMIWQAAQCAMLGSNQIAEAEIDMEIAALNGIRVVRRSSGGGTIFTDMGTLLYTFIMPYTQENSPWEVAAAIIVKALNNMGVPAVIEGRNDILVDGGKVSGLAQYIRNGRVCSHGSLLYDADLATLSSLLTVDEEKVRSKALRSVRSRVTNIRNHLTTRNLTTREFWEALKLEIFQNKAIKRHELTELQLDEINIIYREKYANDEWTYGRAPKFTFHGSKRFGAGKIEFFIDVKGGIVVGCSIKGDFLCKLPIHELEEIFVSKALNRKAFEEALEGVSLSPYLGNVTKDEIIECVFG